MSDPISVVRAFLAAIERKDAQAVAAVLDPEVVQHEWPNALTKHGATRGRDELLAGLARGAALLESERYDVVEVVAAGDRVAVEMEWAATLKSGATMRGRFAAFFTVRRGLVVRADNYDCFVPSDAPQPAAT